LLRVGSIHIYRKKHEIIENYRFLATISGRLLGY
jgi:hypothetical protein